MNANEYADWCKYAGIYPGNVSNGDEFRTYAAKLSPAGLNVLVVRTFVRQNREGVNIGQWRNFYVAGSAADVQAQLEQTTAALHAIGASQAAHLVATSEDTSVIGQLQQFFKKPTGGEQPSIGDLAARVNPADLMNELRQNFATMFPGEAAAAGIEPTDSPKRPNESCESLEQIETLLQNFVEEHIAELKADIQKYGDVRSQPDFDPDYREEQIRQQSRRELMLEQEQEDAAKINQLIAEFHKKAADNSSLEPKNFRQLRRRLHELYARYRDRADSLQADELVESMSKVEELFQTHENLLTVTPIENKSLLARMAAIGQYDCDDEYERIAVTWRKPRGLSTAFKPLQLRIITQNPGEQQFELLMAAAEYACDHVESIDEQIRRDLINQFRELERYGQDWLLEDYERDEDGVIAESTILAETGGGMLEIEITGESSTGVAATVWMAVEWDDEHGFETQVDLKA